jgi:hypothetical protein
VEATNAAQVVEQARISHGHGNALRALEPESSSPAEEDTTLSVPVMDMRFCTDHLDAIRSEAGDFTLKDFSDYWAPDNKSLAPNKLNTFVLNCLI